MNHYTYETIEHIGEEIGQVTKVAFDPSKSQSKGYVRVQVLFDISRPLRQSKLVVVDTGEIEYIIFEYERVRKKCFQCQRLTHDKAKCPLYPAKRHLFATGNSKAMAIALGFKLPIISKDDPLFGVLIDSDVGIDFKTGRPKISKEIIDEMRQYLSVQDGTERQARVERIHRKVWELEGNVQVKRMLCLEAPPSSTINLDKGKGVVLEYKEKKN